MPAAGHMSGTGRPDRKNDSRMKIFFDGQPSLKDPISMLKPPVFSRRASSAAPFISTKRSPERQM
jgi:hypothetical protein